MLLTSMSLCLGEEAGGAGAKKRIVFIAGPPSHGPGEHEHRAGSLLLAGQLEKSGLPVAAEVVSGWPADESVLDQAAAVVIYADGGGGNLAIPHLAKLKELSAKGTGIGCLHYAVEVPKGGPGDGFLDLIGGYFEADWSVNPVWDAAFKLPKNEITRGVADFATKDEWYYHMRFRGKMEGVTPILSALPPAETLTRGDGPHEGNPEVRAAVLERKEVQHVMWTYEAGKVRGFGFTGGHYHQNWKQDDQRRLMLNAIVWLAHLEVPKGGVPTATPTDEEMKANLDKKG
ncbi:MAG: hypothetical protein JWO82_1656 [Akkermansiaceae bacterium]|nr:hypothetical protein [Akkermansiaceae bacterium]